MSIKRDHNGKLIFDDAQVMDGLAFMESLFVDNGKSADVFDE